MSAAVVQARVVRLVRNMHFWCAGEFDNVRHTMSAYFTEDGAGSKDTNLTIDFIILNIIAQKRAGNKIFMPWSDCGPVDPPYGVSRAMCVVVAPAEGMPRFV